jgi:hypothetical protein
MDPVTAPALTYVLIALLNLAVGGTLFGWIYEGTKAGCWERSARFAQSQIEVHNQGPIHEC